MKTEIGTCGRRRYWWECIYGVWLGQDKSHRRGTSGRKTFIGLEFEKQMKKFNDVELRSKHCSSAIGNLLSEVQHEIRAGEWEDESPPLGKILHSLSFCWMKLLFRVVKVFAKPKLCPRCEEAHSTSHFFIFHPSTFVCIYWRDYKAHSRSYWRSQTNRGVSRLGRHFRKLFHTANFSTEILQQNPPNFERKIHRRTWASWKIKNEHRG